MPSGSLSAHQHQSTEYPSTQEVKDALRKVSNNITVRFGTNEIVLEGEVSTYYSKQLAQHVLLDSIAQNGVTHYRIQNNLKVKK